MTSRAPQHFGFAKLVVVDLEAAAAFYTTVFGLKEQARVRAEIAGRTIDEIMYEPTAPGGSTFVLLKFVDQEEPGSAESIYGFITPDLDAIFERATIAGGTIVQPGTSQPEHGVKVGFLADPEGHLIEVVQLL